MDNESTVQTDLEEAVETSTAFDDGWNEDDGGSFDDGQEAVTESEESLETETGSEGTEADADQQEADGTEGEGETDSASETEGEGEAGSPDQGETFTLRRFGEERNVDRDEVIRLAQMGWDYDRVKSELERIRPYERFLQDLADARGSDIESLMDETRTRTILAMAEAKGEKMDPAAAAAQAVRARMQVPEKTEEEKPAEAPINFDGFLKFYAGTVKPEDIPKEVWDEAMQTGELLGPYRGYLNRKLEEDNKRLQKELEQAKQQQKNKERSIGSSRSVGSAAVKDSFDEGWDDSW